MQHVCVYRWPLVCVFICSWMYVYVYICVCMSTVACVYCDAMCLHVFKTENLKRFSLYVSVLYGKPLFMLLLFLLLFFSSLHHHHHPRLLSFAACSVVFVVVVIIILFIPVILCIFVYTLVFLLFCILFISIRIHSVPLFDGLIVLYYSLSIIRALMLSFLSLLF